MQFKRFNTKAEQSDKAITFIASTANPDRYGDIVDQSGWDLRAYERNPIILLNHNPTQLPIGKGKAYVKNGQLMLDVEFDKNDEVAQQVERKVRGGFINAVSVGFQPSESIARNKLPADHPYHGKSGYYFPKSELLEVSIVTIPANNEATLSKHYTANLTLSDVAKSMLVHKHIVSIQELDNGNYLVEFAAHSEPEEIEEVEEVEEQPVEESMQDDEEEKGSGYDDEEKEIDEEEEEKSFSLDDLLFHLRELNN
jgi:HK97 family phage prohead protease